MPQTFAAIPVRANDDNIDAGWFNSLRQAGIDQSGISTGGTRAAPTAITAAGGVTPGTAMRSIQFIKGSGGAVDITANPQIAVGTTVGQMMTLRVPTGEAGVFFEDGTGLSMNGPANLGVDTYSLTFEWDGTEWFCIGRD